MLERGVSKVRLNTTYIIMESLRLAAVVAGLSPLWGGAVEIPEDAPPGVEEPWRLAQRYVLLPADLEK